MSEITKLYENAGVSCKPNYVYNKAPILSGLEYPPFTAEKQIEITKFLLKKAVYYDVKDDKYWFYLEECESAGYKPFNEAIAHFINKLWQDLSPEEKQQVKGILE